MANLDLREGENIIYLCKLDNTSRNIIIKELSEGVECIPWFKKEKFTAYDFLLNSGVLMPYQGNDCVYCVRDDFYWHLGSNKKCPDSVRKYLDRES